MNKKKHSGECNLLPAGVNRHVIPGHWIFESASANSRHAGKYNFGVVRTNAGESKSLVYPENIGEWGESNPRMSEAWKSEVCCHFTTFRHFTNTGSRGEPTEGFGDLSSTFKLCP